MLKKLIGYLLTGAAFIGIGFFAYYKSSLIPLSTLWFFVSLAFLFVGLNFIYTFQHSKSSNNFKERLDKLKQKGEKILLTLENCEIRENNFYEEVITESTSKIEMFDALYDSNRNYKQKYIEQSAIIYSYSTGNKKIRMTSQSFPFNSGTLKNYINGRMIFLYINRGDKNDYVFDMLS